MRRTTQLKDGSLPGTAANRKGHIALSAALAVLGVVLLLAQLSPPATHAQGGDAAWPLTADGRSRFAAWAPDGRTVLVNRWGAVAGDGATRQALSQLWAVDLRSGSATRLSDNAVRPAYAADGQRLAVLSFAGDARWQIRVLDLGSGQERAWSTADWRTPPAWIDGRLAFARAGTVWLSSAAQGEGTPSASADLPAIPAGARVRLSAQGGVAWSDGARLWVVPHPGETPRPLAAEGQVLDFAWSPDGRRLAYLTAGDGLSPTLWVVDVSGERVPVRHPQRGRQALAGGDVGQPASVG